VGRAYCFDKRSVVYKLRFYFLLMMLTSAPVLLAQAQHTSEIPHLIERAVKDKEPDCKVTHISVRKNQEENYAYLIWKCGEQEVRVDINEYSSEEETRITENSLRTADFRLATRLKDIGDEAFLVGEGSYS